MKLRMANGSKSRNKVSVGEPAEGSSMCVRDVSLCWFTQCVNNVVVLATLFSVD